MLVHKCYICMIREIIDLLQTSEYYGVSSKVAFAKGSRKIPYNFKQLKQLIKRLWHGWKCNNIWSSCRYAS